MGLNFIKKKRGTVPCNVIKLAALVREALPVLTHRLATASGSRADGENYLREIVEKLEVPLEDVTTI